VLSQVPDFSPVIWEAKGLAFGNVTRPAPTRAAQVVCCLGIQNNDPSDPCALRGLRQTWFYRESDASQYFSKSSWGASPAVTRAAPINSPISGQSATSWAFAAYMGPAAQIVGHGGLNAICFPFQRREGGQPPCYDNRGRGRVRPSSTQNAQEMGRDGSRTGFARLMIVTTIGDRRSLARRDPAQIRSFNTQPSASQCRTDTTQRPSNANNRVSFAGHTHVSSACRKASLGWLTVCRFYKQFLRSVTRAYYDKFASSRRRLYSSFFRVSAAKGE